MKKGLTPRAKEMLSLLREFQISGKTRKAFCESKRIDISTFGWWKNQLKPYIGTEARLSNSMFIPVTVHDTQRPKSGDFILDFKDGRRLHIPGETAVEALAGIISATGVS